MTSVTSFGVSLAAIGIVGIILGGRIKPLMKVALALVGIGMLLAIVSISLQHLF